MRFFGIDPGTAVTGYGIIQTMGNQMSFVDAGVIITGRDSPLPEKLCQIYDGISDRLTVYKPDQVCIEQAFYAKNVHTTLVLGEARGVAMLAAYKSGVSITEYTPREIKKAIVGKGNATKEQVMFMVKTMLRLSSQVMKLDMYDALAAAICAFYHSHPLKQKGVCFV